MENYQIKYTFSRDVKSIIRNDLRLTIDVEGWKKLNFGVLKSSHADAIQEMFDNRATLDRLIEIAAGTSCKEEGRAAISYYIERFSRARLIEWCIYDQEYEIARVLSLTAGYQPSEDDPPKEPLTLCRFSYIRNTPEGIRLESGAVRAQVLINPHGMSAIGRLLEKPVTATQNSLAEVLWRFGFFDLVVPQENNFRKSWEFHDLLMHEMSRRNRDGISIGKTYRFIDKFESPPAVKPSMQGKRITLPKIDAKKIRYQSGSLDSVQERRKSIREYANTHITLSDISEFLWRVARTTSVWRGKPQELINRAYPAGGRINELEFYVAVGCCEGLEQGFYHYDSHNHILVHVGDAISAQSIINVSASVMPVGNSPDVTIVISSRLPRLAWKYDGMSYRTSLINAGIVIELMYLVATDMNLAPCANGTGNSRLFEKATGIDPFEETSIVEFCLGKRI